MSGEPLTATDAAGRKFTLRTLDPSDMLDLIEAAGAGVTSEWLRFAQAIVSVSEIDGVPVPMPNTKNAIRALAKRVGNDGLIAIYEAMRPAEVPDSVAATAGN